MKLIKIAGLGLAGLGLAGLLVLGAVVLVFGIPAQPVVGYLVDQAEQAGFKLRIEGPATISLWPSLNVSAENIRLAAASDPSEDLVAAKRVRAGISMAALLTGDISVHDVRITQPVIRVTTGRRTGASARTTTARAEPAGAQRAVAIDQVVVEDGTLILHDVQENLNGRIEAIQLTASSPAQGPLEVQAEGKAGGQILRIRAKANSANQIADGRPTPVEARVEIPGLLKAPLSFTASVRAADRIVSIDGVRGTLGSGRVNGSVAVDTAGARPNVNASLVFDRLEFAAAESAAAARNEPWSDQPIEFAVLRVFNGAVRISARELVAGRVQLAPAEVEAQLQSGLLSIVVSRSELYGGPVQGKVVIDAGTRAPRHGASFELANVNALPLLTDAVGFDHFEGRLRAKFDLTAAGASPYAIVSGLGGTAELGLEDGALRNVNIAAMVRALSNQTLQGWQEKGSEKTDFTSLTAAFRVADGQAVTDDLRLAGPLVRMTGKGTVSLVAQTLDFRVDPKLVLSLQGQGGPADPAGLGVPVVIRGPWAEPQIYPDIAGILDNPEAAFSKLKAMGGSLFGLLGSQSGGAAKPKAEDVIKSLDQMLKGDGRNRQPSDRNQVRDVLRDLLGR